MNIKKYLLKQKPSVTALTILSWFIIVVLTTSCKYKEEEYRTDWAGALCWPNNYPFGKADVEFFSNNETNLNFGDYLGSSESGWARNSNFRHFKNTCLPDSLFVSYEALDDKNQTCLFEGGSILPKEKIEQLFKSSYLQNGSFKNFFFINVGLAPGGRVCIWVDHIEISRFTVKKSKKISGNHIFHGDSLSILSANQYLKNHPIDYGVWEIPEQRYNLDFGFCSEDGKSKYNNCYFYSKEGMTIPVSSWDIDMTKWNVPFGESVTISNVNNYQQFNERGVIDKKEDLPVHGFFEWYNNETLYSTELPFPKDFKKKFLKAYINPITGKSANFNRIIFGVEKDGQHCIVWLDGPGKQEKVFRFRGLKVIMKNPMHRVGGYATEIQYY